jgi:hypothetical protein
LFWYCFYRCGAVAGTLVHRYLHCLSIAVTVVVVVCFFVCLFLLPAADEYKYVFLAKNTTEKTEAASTIALWKQRYPDQPFDLEVVLATMDTRDWKTILGSSKHYHFAARGDQKDWLDYCCRACGCRPCWDRPSDKAMGYQCECPQMRGKWKKGNIIQVGAGGAEKRSDTQKLEQWIKSWKKGTFLAIRRIGPAASREEMEVRSYSMTHVCGKAKKATAFMPQTDIHEAVHDGQWYVMVQDMQLVDDDNQKWKKISGARHERLPFTMFHHVDDITMEKMPLSVLQVDWDSHCALQTFYAQDMNDDE